MKNTIRKALLALAVACFIFAIVPMIGSELFGFDPAMTARAATVVDSGSCGENLTWELDDEGTLTISGTGDMKDYYSFYYVPWYSNCSSVKKVIIEDGVTSIGGDAFYNCTSLTSVTIGDSVTNIGDSVFYGCTSLTSVTIPDSVTSIGSSAFKYCYSLTSVTIPDSVTSIGSAAFEDCTSLTSVTIPDSVTSIEGSAFSYCESLTSVTIPDGVTIIGSYAFYNCTSLTTVTIGNSVASIGDDAFSGCTSLTSVTIGNSVTSIGSRAFEDCTSLTSVTIPDSVTSIGIYAFDNTAYYNDENNWEDYVLYIGNHLIDAKTDITGNYVVKGGTKTIAGSAFCNCTSLTSITIPDSITSIGFSAFYNTAYYNDENNWEDNVLYIDNHLIEAKNDITGAYTIKNGTKTIADDAFYGCTSLTSVTIPDDVTSIGECAFYGCSSLTSVNIPDGVTSIGYMAFEDCTSLTSVTIPDSITEIAYRSFGQCTSLTEITIPESVISIGEAVFMSCNALEEITIENPECKIFDSADTISYNATIYGYAGSTAEEYAAKYDRTFVALEPAWMPGDIDKDGNITSGDARLALRASVGLEALTEQQQKVADVTGDGQVTSGDARLILRRSVGLPDE